LAAAAHLTQQQVSKIENGENCNILTYLKASRAIGLNFSLVRASKRQRVKG
jgi:HTH-type transcriptional regulator/antitoxin HipB